MPRLEFMAAAATEVRAVQAEALPSRTPEQDGGGEGESTPDSCHLIPIPRPCLVPAAVGTPKVTVTGPAAYRVTAQTPELGLQERASRWRKDKKIWSLGGQILGLPVAGGKGVGTGLECSSAYC